MRSAVLPEVLIQRLGRIWAVRQLECGSTGRGWASCSQLPCDSNNELAPNASFFPTEEDLAMLSLLVYRGGGCLALVTSED